MSFLARYFGWIVFVSFMGCGPVLEVPPLGDAGRMDPLTFEAVEWTRKTLVKHPRDPNAWANLGLVLVDSGQLIEARKCLENAAYLDPKNPRYPYLLGWSFLPGKPEIAVKYLQTALEQAAQSDPQNPAPYLRLAEALRLLGQDNDAINVLGSLETKTQKHPLGSLILAEIAFAKGNDLEAKNLLQEVPEVAYLAKRRKLLLLLLTVDSYPTVIDGHSIEEIRHLPEDPDWPDPFLLTGKPEAMGLRGAFRLAVAMESKGRWPEAANLLQKIWTTNGDGRARIGLVSALIALARWEDAKKLIEADSSNPLNPLLWARWYLAHGDQLVAMEKGEDARVEFTEGLARLGSRFPEFRSVEGLGLRCRLLWRLEDWLGLKEASQCYLEKVPHHLGSMAFLCLSKRQLGQSGKNCDIRTLREIKYPDPFPETEKVLDLLDKPLAPKTSQRNPKR